MPVMRVSNAKGVFRNMMKVLGLVFSRVPGLPGTCGISVHKLWHPRILRFYVLIGIHHLSSMEQTTTAVSNSRHKPWEESLLLAQTVCSLSCVAPTLDLFFHKNRLKCSCTHFHYKQKTKLLSRLFCIIVFIAYSLTLTAQLTRHCCKTSAVQVSWLYALCYL
jgi:hypothetical protein